MANQFSTGLRNAIVDSIETYIGTGATMEIRSGVRPAQTTDPAVGTLIAAIALPADWLTNAVAGVKDKNGAWADPSADAAGTMGHFRIIKSGGEVCHHGTVGLSAADLIVDNNVVAAGQAFTITAFNYTAQNNT